MSLIEEIQAARVKAYHNQLPNDWKEQVDRAFNITKQHILAKAATLSETTQVIVSYGPNAPAGYENTIQVLGYRLRAKLIDLLIKENLQIKVDNPERPERFEINLPPVPADLLIKN